MATTVFSVTNGGPFPAAIPLGNIVPSPVMPNPASSCTPGDGDECVLRGPHSSLRSRPVPLWRPGTRGRLAFDHELYGETERHADALLRGLIYELTMRGVAYPIGYSFTVTLAATNMRRRYPIFGMYWATVVRGPWRCFFSYTPVNDVSVGCSGVPA